MNKKLSFRAIILQIMTNFTWSCAPTRNKIISKEFKDNIK